ncbi:MAG: quinone-dependent dihydroorotate dehydrogenase [Alphaproteobacteria bacterium]
MIPWPILRRLLFCLPAERAHDLTIAGLRAGLGPRVRVAADPLLAMQVWGKPFANPLGLAAGFDKDARVVAAMAAFGFGFVEVGTLTPRPQPGNPRPRLFRLSEDRAVINRLGFNNGGAAVAAERLALFRARHGHAIVGINIGRNKDSADAVADYAEAARVLGPYADYLVVNVSSPNTPGLRDLQGAKALAELVGAVRAARGPTEPPVLVKIAPDLADGQLSDICALARSGGMDGLVVSNTTLGRPATLRSALRNEAGGLSGAPLMAPSTRLLAEAFAELRGQVPLVGVGGIASAADAYAKIRAGASLVQLYSALIYEGPGLPRRILVGLAERLRADGFTAVMDAIGAG